MYLFPIAVYYTYINLLNPPNNPLGYWFIYSSQRACEADMTIRPFLR